MRRAVLLAIGAASCGALCGCSFEHNTVLNNTAYEGRYTDGDFRERRADAATRSLILSLREAGFHVSRRSAEQLIVDQDFVVTPGEWVVVSEEVVENPETGEEMTNIVREFARRGEAVRITLTGDVVVERGRDESLRAIRYQVWPESERVRMPVEGTDPQDGVTAYGTFMDAVRRVVHEFGAPLDKVESEGATSDG